MNNFTNNFFKKHKEWLERNREYLESSTWHIKPLSTSIETEEKGAAKKSEGLTDLKKAALKNDNDIVKNIIGRITYFVKNTQGEKHLKGNKDVIVYMLDIVNIFIDNCENYLKQNSVIDIENQVVRNIEIKFQDLVFNTKISLEDTLDALGVFQEHEDVKIKFFKDDKASLILREPLVLLNRDVRIIDKSIKADWGVRTSKEMYINMNPRDIPEWNPKKHYFEQELSTIQFWAEEYNKIKHGVTLGGYFIHPWLYFHLNFFKTPIPQRDGTEPITHPDLRDNEWFFAENLKACIHPENPELYSRAILMYGTRRFSKTSIMASVAHWRTITKVNSFGSIIGGSSSDLIALTSMVKTSMTYIDKAFRLDALNQDWESGETIFGLKEDASNKIVFSTLFVQNLQAGAKSKSQATAGLAPSVSLYDEIGKYAFLKPYLAALPSFKTPYGFKCVTVLAGTSGEADLSADAMEVLKNPEVYDLLPMDWDLLESKIDPERVTWKRRKFATFFPGQMAYEEGFVKEKQKFSEFLGIKDSNLSKIEIQVTNWGKNEAFLKDKIAQAKSTKSTKGKLLEQQRKVQYPMDPKDCFITLEGNPFPSAEIKVHKEHIIETGQQGRKVFLTEDANGNIEEHSAEDSPLAEFPFGGGFIDAPIVLHEPLPTTTPPYGLYVASLDDYKHEQSDGDSVGSFTVYKRQWWDAWSLRPVATYATRPDPQTKFYRQGFYLIKAFNALTFPENEDMGFKGYLDRRHVTDEYLMKGIDFAAQFNLNNNGNRAYGWNATPKNIAFGYGLIKNYMEEEIDIIDENGDTQTILGLKRINDIGILEEAQNFTKDGNFDRLRSFMGALMYAHYLDTIWMIPRKESTKSTVNKETIKKKLQTTPFRKSQGKPFRGR